MPPTILVPFKTFPEEAAIIGRLLAGYTMLELSLLHCAQIVRDDFDTVLKAMFRGRSERARIGIADAFGRHAYHGHSLGTEFEMALGAVSHCLQIRNQYAHCMWWDDKSGRLAFANLEEIANTNSHQTGLEDLTTRYVDVPLLTEQETYFVYTGNFLKWVNYEGRVRAGKLAGHTVLKPKQIKQPPLYIP